MLWYVAMNDMRFSNQTIDGIAYEIRETTVYILHNIVMQINQACSFYIIWWWKFYVKLIGNTHSITITLLK